MRLCTSERVREVDVGSVNGRIFLNNVAMGWYPQMLKLRSTLNNERLLGSKRLASLYAALAMRLQRVRTLKGTWRVTTEASTRSGELGTKALLVSNNQYGSVPLDPSARRDLATGQLTLYMLTDLSVNALIGMVDHGARGQLAECPDLDVIHGETVELDLSRAPRRVAVDGELVDAERSYVIKSRHRCLRVVVQEATA